MFTYGGRDFSGPTACRKHPPKSGKKLKPLFLLTDEAEEPGLFPPLIESQEMEHGMFFKLPWFGKKQREGYHDTQVLELDYIVDEFHEAMADIKDPVRTRLQASLMMCESPKDLWFLRSKLFALISKHHCESVAHERVARLDQKLRFLVEHHPDYSPEELPTGPMALVH